MIAKKEWFRRRKYGGWGISPKTWQGWVYIAIILIPFMIFHALPYWDNQTRIYVTLGWIGFLLMDVSHIMFTLNRDEREGRIEAIAERNAAWAMVFVLTAAILYQVFRSAFSQEFLLDPFIIAALIAGALVKSASNIYLERRTI